MDAAFRRTQPPQSDGKFVVEDSAQAVIHALSDAPFHLTSQPDDTPAGRFLKTRMDVLHLDKYAVRRTPG